MKTASFHLNLLKQSERVSSSPVRLRVLVPLLAFFAAAGMAVWWGSLFAQRLVAQSRLKVLASENEARVKTEAKAKEQHAEFLEQSSRLRQLESYSAGIRRIGPALAALAENMPVGIQIIDVSISEPPPQDLRAALPRMPPLRGPTNAVEHQTFTIRGRTPKPLYASKLKMSMRDPSFASVAVSLAKETSGIEVSVPAKGETRPTLFTFEYDMPPRAFVPAPETAGKGAGGAGEAKK